MAEAEIGVIGISGYSSPFEQAETVEVDTPYGRPSAPLQLGTIGDKAVAFLPRRGVQEEIPPPQIPYRANIWAFRELGVRRIVAPVVCGSLRLDIEVGTFVVCDQFVDRTWGRADTYYEGPGTTLVSAAEPFCEDLSRILVETARELGLPVVHGGTAVVIQGPRFSTLAESSWFRQMGWDTVNMITYPECHLARELELCYANLSLVTDYDAGIQGAGAVSALSVTRVLTDSRPKLLSLLRTTIPRIGPPHEDDVCVTALDKARTRF
jgi:5'-methylthioadenosine phosphorylase